MATTVAAIENAANRIATIPVILEKASKPGKERKVTEALNTTAALQKKRNDKGRSVFLQRESVLDLPQDKYMLRLQV
jgi:hypothetical protein